MKNQVNKAEQVTEQSEADRILQNPCASTRTIFTGRLDDQDALARIYAEDECVNVRQAAAGRITDQALLKQIAQNDPDFLTRANAVKNLSPENVELLEKIARWDQHDAPRANATEKLNNQELLAEIVLQDPSMMVRERAIRRIENNPRIFERVMTMDRSAHVRRLAQEQWERARYLANFTCPHCGLRP